MQGESLTQEEQVALEQWYTQQDAEESRLLLTNTPASLADLRQDVNDALVELQQTTERVRSLATENAAMRREVQRLKQMSEAKLIAEQARLNLLFEPLMPEEEAEILEDIKQGEANFAAGRYITLDDLKVKYADRLL